MTDQQVFQLEHFYVAARGRDGQGVQLLAQSPGITREQVAECVRIVQLMPPLPAQRSDAMPGSFGLFRGATVDYIIARAQQGQGGVPQAHYLLASAAFTRRLGGNLHLFDKFAREPFLQFATPRSDLPPFIISNPQPPDDNTQADDLLALLGFANNKIKLIDGLLASIIQGMGLSVINAPLSLADRVSFVQGLLTLLPAPARAGITFATSVIDPRANVQIKFWVNDSRLPKHLTFDWAAGKILDDAPDDVYTKYIMAQLRLDTSLVTQKTERMARTAVWRAMRKDDMAKALAWASRRSSVDDLVDNGQPADPKMLAAILREDPTLSDEARVKYSRSLLAMTLASDDLIHHADVIPEKAAGNRDLTGAVFDQLKSSAENNQALSVYRLIQRWLTEESIKSTGVDVSRWRPLIGFAALAHTKHLLAVDPAALGDFLSQFFEADPGLQLAIDEMIRLSRPRAYEDAAVARIIFLLAVRYLEAGDLQRLLSEPRLMMQLPEPLRGTLPYLQSSNGMLTPPVSLAKAAGVYGPEHQPFILVRLVEWAILLRRPALVDTESMRSILKIAASPQRQRFDTLFEHLETDLGPLEVLQNLDPEMPQYLVELNLLRGHFADAIHQLESYQANLFKNPRSVTLLEMVRNIFCSVPLDEESLIGALQTMQDSRLEPATRASAYVGALEAKSWSPKMAPAAIQLTDILSRAPHITEDIGLDPALELLKANADRRDTQETMRLAQALMDYALELNGNGIDLVCRTYRAINWGPEAAGTALNILRLYIRNAKPEQVKRLAACLGEDGKNLEAVLRAAQLLRTFVGGVNGDADFLAFAEQVQVAALLLIDMAATYYPSEEVPPIWKLKRMVEAMPGGLSIEELQQLADNLNTVGIQTLKLAQLAGNRRRSAETDAHRLQLLRGEIAPTTALDALYAIGGRLGDGQFYPLDLRRKARPQLLGERSVNMLLRETTLIIHLFDGMLAAFPGKDQALDVNAWKAEVDGLWQLMSDGQRRYIQQELVQTVEYLAQTIKVVGDTGHERSFENKGFGQQLLSGRAQPRTVCDALRWLSGYFGKQHK